MASPWRLEDMHDDVEMCIRQGEQYFSGQAVLGFYWVLSSPAGHTWGMQYCYFCSDLVLYFALSHTLTEVSQTDKRENKENTHALHLVDHTKAHTHIYIYIYIPILVAHNQSTVPTVLPYILPWCNPVQRSPVVFLALNLIISTTLSNYHCYQEPCNT